ncbi:MAG TPA: sugar phosphate isomerase/epimerase [Bryobacteraceae bacterium]|nr:sugar phosphate isomerase/epimerase [Bryobacteraceae bacterium]
MNRRQLLASFAAGSLALQAKKLKNIGCQLYTLRSVIESQPKVIFNQLDDAGYDEVEAVRASLPKIWDALKASKLKPVSLHIDTALFTRDLDKLDAALDDARSKGFRYVVCPYIAPQDRGGVKVIKRLAETLNKAGAKCKAAGTHLCYHNHAFEFEPVAGGKGNLLDVLLQSTDPALVGLEFDIMWAAVGGVDPVTVLEKYKGRVPLLHVKDLGPNLTVQYNEKVPKTAFKEAGAGILELPKILRTAQATGTKHFFVEQDQTPGDPMASLKQSIAYLKKLDL